MVSILKKWFTLQSYLTAESTDTLHVKTLLKLPCQGQPLPFALGYAKRHTLLKVYTCSKAVCYSELVFSPHEV